MPISIPTRRKLLRDIKLENCVEPHAGLWLDKFIEEQRRENKEARRDLVGNVAAISIFDSYRNCYDRWKMGLDSLEAAGYALALRKAKVDGRMILGTGNESVLETAVTLHRTYGVPYIPGSALKGLSANFARHHCGSDWARDSDNYRIVFGNTAESGCIVFFDALYLFESGARPLRSDVLTPHHRAYYSRTKIEGRLQPPADWDDPNPVHFLSATGSYLIALAASAGGEKWLAAVMTILATALKNQGIGAKTSSGYGRLSLEAVEDGRADQKRA
jgi:CRISPR-associated protein Cmr6